MSYSKKLKRSPDFTDFVMVEKLCFRGCERLQKLHPSIGHLINLGDLDMGECSRLKELPETIGQLCKLGRFDLPKCFNLKRLPQHIKQLGNLRSLNLKYCRNLIQLPEQLGDMKGLKMINASHTAIEQLPDSIGQLKALRRLDLSDCRKLRKLPEQFGNMEGLKTFDASGSGIEELPDSTGQLINLASLKLSGCNLASLPDSLQELKLLKELNLNYCSKLERLPEQLGKMQSLEYISAYRTAIQELPDSILLLSRLEELDLSDCDKLKYVPNDIWNLKSLESLYLPTENMFISNLPENHTKNIKSLRLTCDIRSWLPTLQNFSSLTRLNLCDEGKNLSSTKWCLSLSKHSNLEELTLDNWGSSFLELPLNLRELWLSNNATVEQLPDLSNLEHLEELDIMDCISLQSLPPLPLNLKTVEVKGCTSLQSLPPLPLNLERLTVDRCTSLKDVPDLAILKKLYCLRIHHCSSLKSIDLKQSSLQVRRNSYSSSFSALLPDRKIAEWFDYKNKGSTVSLNIPSSVLGDDFLGIALWVVFKCKIPDNHNGGYIRAVITNKTEDIKNNYDIDFSADRVDYEVQSMVQCISRHKISVKSGDKIKVSFQKSLYRYNDYGYEKIPVGELKVENCGAHVILKDTSSTP